MTFLLKRQPDIILSSLSFNDDVKVGDKVLFGKYSGTEVKIEGNEYLMMREDDVLGVVE
mgnify:CR=1 FL=1